jgi:hypothetical protein
MDRGAHPTRLKQLGRHKSYAVLDEYLELGDPFGAHPLNGERRNAMADQITTTSKRRLLRHLGTLGAADLASVCRVVRLQLRL